MCNVDRESIIEKIKKLLAVAGDNANENEAIAAALMAQKLIAKHNIEDFELENELVKEEIVDIKSPKYTGKQWRLQLADTIATNFRCQAYRSTSHDFDVWDDVDKVYRNKCYRQIHFVGYESDAHAAALVYQKLADVGERLASEAVSNAKRKYGTSAGVKNTFLLGFVYGVKSELEKQSVALMLVVPSEVKEVTEAMNLYSTKFELQSGIDASDEGYDAGKDAVRASRLEGGSSNFELNASKKMLTA